MLLFALTRNSVTLWLCVPNSEHNSVRISMLLCVHFVFRQHNLMTMCMNILISPLYAILYRYHHVTVLVYAWYSYTEHTATARWFVVMNYTIHSIMYSYYAFKALR